MKLTTPGWSYYTFFFRTQLTAQIEIVYGTHRAAFLLRNFNFITTCYSSNFSVIIAISWAKKFPECNFNHLKFNQTLPNTRSSNLTNRHQLTTDKVNHLSSNRGLLANRLVSEMTCERLQAYQLISIDKNANYLSFFNLY